MSKRPILTMTIVATMMFGLTACGSLKTPSATGNANANRLSADYSNALPVETQLVLGTLKLEGSGNAVDTAEASNLLPFYSLLQEMTTSGTSSQAEIDAVLEQIQADMTTEQIHAIAAMKLTQADMTSFFGSAGQFSSTGTPGAGFNGGGGFPPAGGGDAGGPPAGFTGGGGGGGAAGGGGGGTSLNQNQIATLRAQRGTPGAGGSGSPVFLINQLIQVLQRKIQSLTPTGNLTPTNDQTPAANLTPTEM